MPQAIQELGPMPHRHFYRAIRQLPSGRCELLELEKFILLEKHTCDFLLRILSRPLRFPIYVRSLLAFDSLLEPDSVEVIKNLYD